MQQTATTTDVGHTLKAQLREKLGLRKCVVCKEWGPRRTMARRKNPDGSVGYYHRRHMKEPTGGDNGDGDTVDRSR